MRVPFLLGLAIVGVALACDRSLVAPAAPLPEPERAEWTRGTGGPGELRLSTNLPVWTQRRADLPGPGGVLASVAPAGAARSVSAVPLVAPQYYIIFQNRVTGDRALWAMNGTTPPGQAIPLPWEKPEWSMVGAADFTADGIPDILFQNTTTGQRGWWVMNGTKWAGWIGTFAEKPEWSMVDAADYTGDGKPDVLLQNTITGVRGFWEMKDTRFNSWIPIFPEDPAWQMVGSGDFTGTGKRSILFQNTKTGMRGIWEMNGTTFVRWIGFFPEDPAWQMRAVYDVNGDGSPDIFFQNINTGVRGWWMMNRTSFASWQPLGVLDPNWDIVGVLPPTGPPRASQIAANGGSTTGTAGQTVAIPPSVIVRDANSNPVGGVSVTFVVASGGGSITGASATTNAAGVANVGSWTLGSVAGTNTLTATVSGLAPLTFSITAAAMISRWVTGYWVGYQASMYLASQVDMSLLTHVVMGAVEPVGATGLDTTFYLDNIAGPAAARSLSSRAHAAGKKAILMLGGASYISLLKTSTSTANKATFEANLLRAMDSFGYDGIDVDWEPLATTDQAQVLTFLKELRISRPSMIITFPLNWVGSNSTPDTWLAQLAPVVDQINIMSYEMADAYPGWTSWHEAALYGETSSHPSSVSSSANIFIRAGVPAAKLGVGLGAYGSCWSGATGMNQSPGSGVIASDNTMTYAHIMSSYYSVSAYHWDATAREGYLSWSSSTGPEGCTMLSYEDATSIAEKVAFVKSAGLGGVMMWTINQGHISTAAAGQQDPLLTAASAVTTP